MQILDDQMRVLVIAGSPTYDYRFLTRMLERDATVDVSTWLQSADVGAVRDGDTIITELPTRQEELFQYDAILLIDPDPENSIRSGSLVATFVTDHGGGLLYARGTSTPAFFRSPSRSRSWSCFGAPEPDAEIILNELGQYQVRAWAGDYPETALGDSILRQTDQLAENRVIGWRGASMAFSRAARKAPCDGADAPSNPRMVNASVRTSSRRRTGGLRASMFWPQLDLAMAARRREILQSFGSSRSLLVEGKLLAGGRAADYYAEGSIRAG